MSSTSSVGAAKWDLLYRAGGTAAVLFVLFGLAALALYVIDPPPVSGGVETLVFIAAHKASYIAQQLLWLVPSLFGLVAFVALFVAVLPRSPSLSVLGFAVGAASWTALLAVPVTSEGTLSLVYLSDQYMSTKDPVAQAAFIGAAEALVAENNTVSLAGALTPLGILLISLPLASGGRSRWVGRLGLAAGSLGLVSEAMRFAIPALYAVYGPLLWLWFAAVGIFLLKMPARGSSASARGTDVAADRSRLP